MRVPVVFYTEEVPETVQIEIGDEIDDVLVLLSIWTCRVNLYEMMAPPRGDMARRTQDAD